MLDILLLFQDGKERKSIDEISQALDLPKSTAYRLVRILQESGLLEKAGSAHYQLGVTFLKLSRVALNSNRDIRLMALPGMKRVAEAVAESVSLMRLMNRQVVCIESIEGQHALRVSIEQGRTQLLHAGASSRVLLAHLPESEWPDYLEFPLRRFTETTITDFQLLTANLRQVRRDGYTVSNGEIDIGARAVAVPLFNSRDEVVAALSIEAPAMRMPDETARRYIELLQQEAARIRAG
ncbi:MAG: IclR family transcriptional regulator [Phototrophicaceae bacterium]